MKITTERHYKGSYESFKIEGRGQGQRTFFFDDDLYQLISVNPSDQLFFPDRTTTLEIKMTKDSGVVQRLEWVAMDWTKGGETVSIFEDTLGSEDDVNNFTATSKATESINNPRSTSLSSYTLFEPQSQTDLYRAQSLLKTPELSSYPFPQVSSLFLPYSPVVKHNCSYFLRCQVNHPKRTSLT